jgi:two-component system, NtrC family, sensor kinase
MSAIGGKADIVRSLKKPELKHGLSRYMFEPLRCVVRLGEPMRQRNKTGGKAANRPRHKTLRAAPKVKRRDEALGQQAATAEVLKIISSSRGQLEPVFQAILANAVRICEAKFGVLYPYENGVFRPSAEFGVPPALSEFIKQRGPFRPRPKTTLERLIQTKQVIYCTDILAEDTTNPMAKFGNARTYVAIPLLNETQLVGTIIIYRQEVRPFADTHIELLTTFAAQAVIAIENARLVNELRQRTDDLSEALEQQRASAEVLNVISNSVSDAEPVFEKIVESCERIFATSRIGLNLIGPDGLVHAGAYGKFPGAEKLRRENFPHPVPGSATEAAISAGRPIQYPDALSDSDVPQYGRRAAKIVGFRAFVMAPLLSEGRGLGAIFVGRETIGSFSDKEIALLKTFAAQAVIAIENTRLLNELRESLQQQTATADVLKVISSSAGELQPVFKTMLAKAVERCEASFGAMWLVDGEGYRTAAMHGDLPQAYVEQWRSGTLHLPKTDIPMVRAIRSRKTVHTPDMRKEKAYLEGDPLAVSAADIGGIRTLVTVPMLKEGEAVGVITIYRREVLPFNQKQIELVQNFAAQAVIAIENTRLLSELRESLQQQTATSDVLKVISRSTFDLQTVLNTLVESAARVCEADTGTVRRRDGDTYPLAATFGLTQQQSEHFSSYSEIPDRGSVFGRAILENRTIHVPDILADPEYNRPHLQEFVSVRAALGVPLVREGTVIGVFTLQRREPHPFTEKQIELVTTFADQAVIAIENVRLFNSVEARTRELAASLEDLRTTQDRLVQTQKLASLGQLTAGIAHEIKNPLNFVNNFSAVSGELIDDLQETLKGIAFDDKARAEIDELTKTLQGNLDKVVQHGKRADGIVKNMLLHSREGSGEHRPVDINALVDEGLNLAYHGARAEKQGFNIKLEKSFDPNAGEVDVFPQDITRVLLNLISNGFYAATKRSAESNGGDYEPTLAAATKNRGDRVEITIRDNGTGIPADVKEKMFNPFFTTKPAGEGTGLGLSISHDIVVKQHGGSIEVETQPGAFTEIRIVLPRAAASLTGGRA